MIHLIVRGYNCEKYARRCIISLMAQTYENWQAYIILDGCSDDTVDILSKFYENRRMVILIHGENHGPGFNMNFGRKLVLRHGDPEDVAAVLDLDDYLHPRALQKTVKFYAEKKCLATCGSFVSEKTGKLHKWNREYPRGANHRKHKFCASHFKTVKLKVLEKIPESYFRHGTVWAQAASDLALMLPVIDLVGLDNLYHTWKPLYVYNDMNLNNIKRNKQIKWREIIKAKKPLTKVW